MTRALWAVLFLSVAQNAHAAESDKPAVAAPQTPVQSERRATVTNPPTPVQGSTGSSVRKNRSQPQSARFKEDLASCRMLESEDRRTCEREMHAARSQGLYKD